MTKKEIDSKTNLELGLLLSDKANFYRFDMKGNFYEIVMEAARRLMIEPRVPFNDEQFNV